MARSESRANIIWAPSAERDLGRLYTYLEADSPKGAARMVTRVVRAIDMLELQPELGAIAADVDPPGRCRQLIVAPLRVIYRVADDDVHILRIWDSRRDPKSLHVPNEPLGDEHDK
jgi:plasmid stabilization system protein ParE